VRINIVPPEQTSQSTWGLYLCSTGATAIVAIFDGVMNDKSAALKKFGGWFATTFGSASQTSTWFVIAIVFFCLVAALATFAYKPSSPKEAFILGAGALAMMNAFVKTPLVTDQSAPPSQSTAPAKGVLNFLPFSSANAQEQQVERVPIWLSILGVPTTGPLTSQIYVYEVTTGRNVEYRIGGSGFRLELPRGNYYIEVSRSGYRSLVFPVNADGTSFFQLKLEQTKIDGLANLFGPQSITLKNEVNLARSLEGAINACGASNPAGAQNALRPFQRSLTQPITSDKTLSRLLCAF
jgi:hypothetical protein